MLQALMHTALIVRDYDEAIGFFVGKLGFELREDTRLSADKRWVVVAPRGGGASILLAKAADERQSAAIGEQGAGRVFLFLATADIARDHAAYTAQGVVFTAAPRVEPYGIVAVFEDLYGNRWDLIEAAQPVPPDVPEGFVPHFRKSGLTDPWEPIYSRTTADAVIIGLRAGPAHVNSRGFVHGGLISALADNAMGLSCGLGLPGFGLVTTTLNVDFLSTARVSQWLAFETSFRKIGSTLCFAQAFVTADDAVCARANASFRTIKAAGSAG